MFEKRGSGERRKIKGLAGGVWAKMMVIEIRNSPTLHMMKIEVVRLSLSHICMHECEIDKNICTELLEIFDYR